MRKIAREKCLALVFEFMFLKEEKNIDEVEFVNDNNDLTEDDLGFIKNTYSGIVENFDNLKEEISKYLIGYSIDRIYKVDLAILLISLYEIKQKQNPIAVVIDEAVRLAKMFSTDKSLGFINGVLAEYVKRTNEN